MSVPSDRFKENSMLISDAYADPPAIATTPTPAPLGSAATTTPSGTVIYDAPSPLSGMGILLLIPLVLYLLVFRPNQKKIREYEAMVKALRRGDRVVTGGGIIGVITKIENDDVLVVEIAPDTKVRVMRETISHVVNKTAVNDNKAEEKPAKKPDDKAGGA